MVEVSFLGRGACLCISLLVMGYGNGENDKIVILYVELPIWICQEYYSVYDQR